MADWTDIDAIRLVWVVASDGTVIPTLGGKLPDDREEEEAEAEPAELDSDEAFWPDEDDDEEDDDEEAER